MPAEHGEPVILEYGDLTQTLATEVAEPEIVVLAHQLVPARFLVGPHSPDAHFPQRGSRWGSLCELSHNQGVFAQPSVLVLCHSAIATENRKALWQGADPGSATAGRAPRPTHPPGPECRRLPISDRFPTRTPFEA